MSRVHSLLESIATIFVEISGNGFNPEGCKLPAFKAYKPPTAKVPVEKKKAVEQDQSDIYTWEEIEAMDSSAFAIKVGGAKSKEDFAKQAKEAPPKKQAVVFDDLDASDHGITPREYGEMLAYTPSLRDLKLAAKVKAGVLKGKNLRTIAEESQTPYQLIRHYSAALGRANND